MSRINFLDTTKGLGILIVIWNHSCAQYIIKNEFINGLCLYFASFWMPLFFIISGVFLNDNKDTFNVFVTKRLKSIITPLIIFYFLSFILSYIATQLLHIKLNNTFEWSNIYALVLSKPFSNGALWFLSALFFSHIIYFAILNLTSNKYFKLLLVLVISIIGFLWNNLFKFRLPLYIDTAMTSILFLYIGSFILWLIEKFENIKLQLLLVIGIGIIVYLMKDYASSMVTNSNNAYYFIPYYIVGFLGTFWIVILSQLLSKLSIIEYYGRFSIVLLCCHYLFITPFKLLAQNIFENDIFQVIFIFISISLIMYPVVYIVNRYFPFIIGKSNKNIQ